VKSVVQDEACAAVDEEKASSASEYETDEDWEDERKNKQANQLKEQVPKYSVADYTVCLHTLCCVCFLAAVVKLLINAASAIHTGREYLPFVHFGL